MPGQDPKAASRGRQFRPSDIVDFVVVGSGSAGGVVARELARAGFDVVVLEQGPWLAERDFIHDELAVFELAAFSNDHRVQPTTFRRTESDLATRRRAIMYGRAVGGGSVHFSGNYWRFRESDFVEASRHGGVPGAAMADWPISYAELEPYYTKVDWEIGVSGLAGADPGESPRSRPYPLPPLPPKSTGVLLEQGAKRLGWTAFPAPLAILSRPYRGRSPCVQCGMCLGFGCEVRAKSSTLVTMIPEAVATGRCEVRPLSYVRKVESNSRGRVTGVKYFDAARKEIYQRAKAVVVCANGAETPRLLLMSANSVYPTGLANGNGLVGRHLMFNGAAIAAGRFTGQVNGYRGTVASTIVLDTYDAGPALGLSGGGGFDFRFPLTPIGFGMVGLAPDEPSWGPHYKRLLRDSFTRTVLCFGHLTSLPVATNAISLDPTLRDAWGLPAIRITHQQHPLDVRLMRHFLGQAESLLQAAGAAKVWPFYLANEPDLEAHLLGTCRMGRDPVTSVVDADHRCHQVPNLFLVDGSSFVTSGRGQPTMTIQALAFRAADRIAALVRQGALSDGARRG